MKLLIEYKLFKICSSMYENRQNNIAIVSKQFNSIINLMIKIIKTWMT